MASYRVVLPLLLAAALLAGAPAAFAQTEPMELSRSVTPVVYTPGGEIVVTLTLTKNDPRGVTALGVIEDIPDTWTLVRHEGVSEDADPPIVSQKNGTVEFAYITVPAFPVQFSYTLRAGDGDTGPQGITGTVLYRFGSGNQLDAAAAATVLQSADEVEGEGEGEGDTAQDDGCAGCRGCAREQAEKLGVPWAEIFTGMLSLVALAALSRAGR